MEQRVPCEKNSCLWLEGKGMMASTEEFCPSCRAIDRYSPSFVSRHGLVTKGVCHLLYPPASTSEPIRDQVVQPRHGHTSSPGGEHLASPLNSPSLQSPPLTPATMNNRASRQIPVDRSIAPPLSQVTQNDNASRRFPCDQQTSPPLIQKARNITEDSPSPAGECPASPLKAPRRVLRYPTRESHGVCDRFIAELANNGSNMNTASNPSQSKVFVRIQKRFHNAVNALRANPLGHNQRVNREAMELLASAGDLTHKENIFIPKGGTSTAAVTKRQVLGEARICGSEMPQELKDEIVRAAHRRQSVLKTLVECSDGSDGIGSNSSGGDCEEGPASFSSSIDTVQVGP
jgi:hypothetical protein